MPEPHVTTWSEAPQLAIPDPPAVLSDYSNLWLAYETTGEPSGEVYAVVRFLHVIDHRLSPINDEGLGQHRYARAGLQRYCFNEVANSAEINQWRVLKPRHWVITFKDNTLDVLAENAEVVVASMRGSNPVSVLLSLLAARGGAA